MADKLITRQAVLAFIDVLGAKDMIKKDMDGSLKTVHEVYEKSLEIYEKVFANKLRFDIAIFSDNIVVALCVKDKCQLGPAFKAVHTMAAIIQGNFLFSGILSRGGIAYGGFFKDEVMLWGDALVKAYSLESTVAVYPRIVIDPELVGRLGYFQKETEAHNFWLKQDNDGLLYVDYLQPKFIKEFELALLGELSRDEQRAIDYHGNTRYMQKVNWHLNYVKSKLGSE